MGRTLRQCGTVRPHQRRLGRGGLALWTVSARLVTTRADAGAGGRKPVAARRRLAESRPPRPADRIQRKSAPIMKANSILDNIGKPPHIRMAKLFPDAEAWLNSETSNPGDRKSVV